MARARPTRTPLTKLARARLRRPPRTPGTSGAGPLSRTRTRPTRPAKALRVRPRRTRGSGLRPARPRPASATGGWGRQERHVGASLPLLENHVVRRMAAAARRHAEWILRLPLQSLDQADEQLGAGRASHYAPPLVGRVDVQACDLRVAPDDGPAIVRPRGHVVAGVPLNVLEA